MRALWEILIVRIIAYIIFAAILFGGWRLVNAQTRTICQAQGGQIVCTQQPTVQFPLNPGFDSSVIGQIGQGAQLSPEAIRYLMIKKCVTLGVQQGLTDDQIRARCFR